MAKIKTYPFDAAALLDSEEAVLVFLEEALAANDPAVVARAESIAERARQQHRSRAGQHRRHRA
jgi:DNA-binding phage protein